MGTSEQRNIMEKITQHYSNAQRARNASVKREGLCFFGLHTQKEKVLQALAIVLPTSNLRVKEFY
jgi:hypothetical protein